MSRVAPPLLERNAASLLPFVAAGLLGAAEVHGADALTRADPGDHLVRLGAAFALWAPLHGHVCFDVSAAPALVAAALASADADAGDDDAAAVRLPWPDPDAWLTALRRSALVRVADRHDETPVLDAAPLVLFGSRLYPQRQWVDECVVTTLLRARAGAPDDPALHPAAAALLDTLLPPTAGGELDAQHLAALAAVQRPITVVTGGPGTGKTHTIARLVATLLADAAARGERLRVALAAPTGKAAQRVGEAITGAAATGMSGVPTDVVERLREVPALTLHRLLGPLPTIRTRFHNDASHPLPYDVVVVDETSMVPLPMMARLLEALPSSSKLVLVGDPDQLSSIDAGTILGDVVQAAASPASALADSVVRLHRSHRQEHGSPIGPLSDAIRDGLADDVLTLLRGGGELVFLEHPDPLSADGGAAVRELVADGLDRCRRAALDGDDDAALTAASAMRILCAHRRGPFGADAWNEALGSWMLGGQRPPRNFAGRTLLVTRNDLRNRLSNGDSGVVVSRDDRLLAAFRIAGEITTFAPAQLESVETAFATTVHKSQGSEYDTVVVVLPPPGSPLARRELLYTAVTRAARRVIVVGSAESVVASVTTRTPRASGLVDGLCGRTAT